MPALGLIGKANIATPDVDQLIATMDAIGIVNICVCNTNATVVIVNVAIGTGGAPAAGDYIEYQCSINPGKPLERTGFVLIAGEKIWVRSNTANVSVRVHGIAAE